MNKKFLTLVFSVALSSMAMAEEVSFKGKGACSMLIEDKEVLAKLYQSNAQFKFVWAVDDCTYIQETGMKPLDCLKESVTAILPDAEIESYRFEDASNLYLNVKTKGNDTDLLSDGAFQLNEGYQQTHGNDVVEQLLPPDFKDTKEFKKCKEEAYNKALVEAANNFFKIAKAMGPAEEDCELSLEKDKLRIDCRYSN